MANTRKARNQGQNQPSAEAPVDSEIKRAAERIGYESAPRSSHAQAIHDSEEQRHADARSLRFEDELGVGGRLRALLACGLYTDDGYAAREGCGYDVVMRTLVLAQLKAIALALSNAGEDQGGDGYSLALTFTGREAAQALAGTCALLENAPTLIDLIRSADDANDEAEVAS